MGVGIAPKIDLSQQEAICHFKSLCACKLVNLTSISVHLCHTVTHCIFYSRHCKVHQPCRSGNSWLGCFVLVSRVVPSNLLSPSLICSLYKQCFYFWSSRWGLWHDLRNLLVLLAESDRCCVVCSEVLKQPAQRISGADRLHKHTVKSCLPWRPWTSSAKKKEKENNSAAEMSCIFHSCYQGQATYVPACCSTWVRETLEEVSVTHVSYLKWLKWQQTNKQSNNIQI